MNPLCKYKDVFGKPNEGIHSIRLFGIAIVDLILTMILAYAIVYYSKKQKKKYNYWVVLAILLVVAFIVHKMFCVKTSVNTTIDNWLQYN